MILCWLCRHCTFANGPPGYAPTHIPDTSGGSFTMTGVCCALSFDDGDSWKRRPITTDFTAKGHNQTGFDGRNFSMSFNTTEPNGYMAAAVSDDGIITLITSRNSYSFNLAWLNSTAAAPPSPI